MRQLGDWSGREAAQFAPTNRALPVLYAVSPKGKATTPMSAAALHPRQHRKGPGARDFNTGHAEKGPGTATSCPAVTSPSGPGISRAWKIIIFYLHM